MKNRKMLMLFAVILICTMFAAGCGGGAETKKEGEQAPAEKKAAVTELRFGGSGTSTWIYGFCVAMSELSNAKLTDVKLNVQATAGSSSHYGMFKKNEIDLGSGSTFIDSLAYAGKGNFTEKFDTFSAILPTSISCGHIMTAKESKIDSVKKLEGKKVGIGARGSPTSMMAELILNTLGIKANIVTSTPDEMVEMFKDNRLDAIIYFAGAPNSIFLDIASAREIKFIPLTSEEQQKMAFAFSPSQITDKDYAFVTTPVPNLIDYQCVLANDNVSDEVIYKIVKAVEDNWGEFAASLPATKKVSAKDIVNLKTPIHPGAIKYYEEKGIKIPDSMKK